MKKDRLNLAMRKLQEAMSAVADIGATEVSQAVAMMSGAMNRLQQAAKKTAVSKAVQATEHEKWWGHITSGVTAPYAASPTAKIAPEAAVRNYKALEELMGKEQKKIDDLEKEVLKTHGEDLLQD
jgi:hypothetical protein